MYLSWRLCLNNSVISWQICYCRLKPSSSNFLIPAAINIPQLSLKFDQILLIFTLYSHSKLDQDFFTLTQTRSGNFLLSLMFDTEKKHSLPSFTFPTKLLPKSRHFPSLCSVLNHWLNRYGSFTLPKAKVLPLERLSCQMRSDRLNEFKLLVLISKRKKNNIKKVQVKKQNTLCYH